MSLFVLLEVFVDALLDMRHNLLVVVSQVDYLGAGSPYFISLAAIHLKIKERSILWAMSMSLRGKPSSVVNGVSILTPC